MSKSGRFCDREKAIEAAKKSGQTERKSINCPKCGEEFTNLPIHLRGCDGPEEGGR